MFIIRVSNLDDEARVRDTDTTKENAIDAYKPVMFTAKLLRDSGTSYADIAQQLNKNGFRTRTGKEFKPMTVKRILDQAMS